MEEKDRICLLCDQNIIELEYRVIMSCPVYNELCGELINHVAQFEPNFSNPNDDEMFLLYSQLQIYVFILPRPVLIFLLSEENCCIILDIDILDNLSCW